ncbi:MAG: cupin domain-containing protein [Actinomycetota bacterium]
MPSVSRNRIANIDDYGAVEDRHEDVDGTTVAFLTFREEVDAAPLLRGLPGDRCNCPHWGYVFTGKVTFALDDREEVYEAGDAFCVPPGHVPHVAPGTEYLQFSPAEELRAVSDHIQRTFAALHDADGVGE